MIIAGEASGDLHGASLIKELKAFDPGIEVYGIGGDKMIAQGMTALYNIRQMAFLGFVEVIRHLPFIKKVQRDLIAKINSENINTIVLIDYPGFNLDIAKKLNAMNKKLIYYISPQVWAWGKGRIKKIKEIIDKMLVVFPFEETMYRENGVDSIYVGHPLIEHIENYSFLSKEKLYNKFDLESGKEILLLMPGSRKQEIKKIFPACIEAAERLAADFNMQTVVACSENIDEKFFYEHTDKNNFKIVKGFTYDLLKHSRFGIVKSGTSTLEAGIFQMPFIVVYSTSALTYFIGKLLVKIKNIAMANILLGETVIDELIQNDVNVSNIYVKASRILLDKDLYAEIKKKLGKIKTKLGGSGASKRAAEIIYAELNEA